MKRAAAIAFLLFALVASVQGSPISIDNLWVNLAISVVFFWIIIRWLLGRRRRQQQPQRIIGTPTTYAGITFRSKTEAAWAERFDCDGRGWLYEPRWYKLRRDGRHLGYLPDFELDDGTIVEIKGMGPTEEEQWKCQQVANITGRDALIYAGWPGRHSVYRFEPEAARQWIG